MTHCVTCWLRPRHDRAFRVGLLSLVFSGSNLIVGRTDPGREGRTIWSVAMFDDVFVPVSVVPFTFIDPVSSNFLIVFVEVKRISKKEYSIPAVIEMNRPSDTFIEVHNFVQPIFNFLICFFVHRIIILAAATGIGSQRGSVQLIMRQRLRESPRRFRPEPHR